MSLKAGLLPVLVIQAEFAFYNQYNCRKTLEKVDMSTSELLTYFQNDDPNTLFEILMADNNIITDNW